MIVDPRSATCRSRSRERPDRLLRPSLQSSAGRQRLQPGAYPLRDYVTKLGAIPASKGQRALSRWRLDPRRDEDGFRHAAVDFLRSNNVVSGLKARHWTDAEQQPIEDASVDWPASISPYRTVATTKLPRQEAYREGRVWYFEEIMTFRPTHGLEVHRPLGSVMRARLKVYRALSEFRHRQNGVLAK